MRLAALSLSVLLAAGCATTGTSKHGPLTPQEETDLARAMQTPLAFEIPSGDAQIAWGRAQVFVHKHSRMKIQTATDYVIETYNLDCSVTAGARYVARKIPGTDAARVEVDCTACWLDKEQVLVNAHVFAHYVKTGELVCDRDGFNACLVQ